MFFPYICIKKRKKKEKKITETEKAPHLPFENAFKVQNCSKSIKNNKNEHFNGKNILPTKILGF